MKSGKAKSPGQLRIIGGQWRSRRLPVVDLPGLRPTTDRVRETLFNWLQNDVPGARCLDLFAGSGALGFEAASRGAASVVMLEMQSQAVKLLQQNMQALQANTMQLIAQDAMQWLQKPSPVRFDIVFIDPPFDSDYLASACELLEQNDYLAEQACIYLEMDSHQSLPELPCRWHVVRQKKQARLAII